MRYRRGQKLAHAGHFTTCFGVSHSRDEETREAKTRWFQSLGIEEQIAMLDERIALIFENSPNFLSKRRRDVDCTTVGS
jgi:hypothetical protein